MHWVLFFDGECGFCSHSVQRLIKFDRHKVIFFSRLQGELAAKHGLASYAEKGGGSMVILRQPDAKIFTHSDAAIELARALGGIWKLTIIAKWIPKAWRDAGYSFVARRRHWLSRKLAPTCQLPTAELAQRFID
ncbi:MAG: DUF393 domain-containing protein [Verrucomicrobia bacterium]|nr:MAG: DUF393 domain-containing protein [Verrucomicrobiota bacterium]